MAEGKIEFAIIEHLCTLSQGVRGWTKEVNIVRWNNRRAKIDIREWDENHEKMSKGVTLSKSEMMALKDWLQKTDVDLLEID